MRVNGILLVSSFCDDCSAVSRSISWARCLPVVTAEHFLTFVVKIGVVTTKALIIIIIITKMFLFFTFL